MPKFTGLSAKTLKERLGPPAGRHMTLGSNSRGHAFQMFWFCNGPNGPPCYAFPEAPDKSMPPDLTPWEQELFDTSPFPRKNWTLKPCPDHRNLFADHEEQPD